MAKIIVLFWLVAVIGLFALGVFGAVGVLAVWIRVLCEDGE